MVLQKVYIFVSGQHNSGRVWSRLNSHPHTYHWQQIIDRIVLVGSVDTILTKLILLWLSHEDPWVGAITLVTTTLSFRPEVSTTLAFTLCHRPWTRMETVQPIRLTYAFSEILSPWWPSFLMYDGYLPPLAHLHWEVHCGSESTVFGPTLQPTLLRVN